MTYHGTVRNGVIVLPEGIVLPDGLSVEVHAPESNEPALEQHESIYDFDFEKLAVDTGIPDLAINHDHYLYGLPKVTDEK